MTAVKIDEVREGLVIHLDPDILRQLGGSSATVKAGHGVAKPHYFLVISVEDDTGYCLAMPLFSEPGRDRDLLDENLKDGRPANWRGESSYLFRWQVWRIPLRSIEHASVTDESDLASRRLYAVEQAHKLEDLRKLLDRNNQPFAAI